MSTAFESQKMKDSKKEFVRYHTSNVDGEPINDIQLSVIGQNWFSWCNFLVLNQGINQNDVESVCQDEEE